MVNEIIGEVSLALYFLPVVIKKRTEVVPPMPGGKSVKLIEPTSERMVGRLCAIVPFSKCSGGVSAPAGAFTPRSLLLWYFFCSSRVWALAAALIRENATQNEIRLRCARYP